MAHKKILIINGCKAENRIFSDLLYDAGYDVECVSRPSDGLIAATNRRYDLVVVDGKPDMVPGHLIARSLNRNPATHNTPIVGIGEFSDEEEKELTRYCDVREGRESLVDTIRCLLSSRNKVLVATGDRAIEKELTHGLAHLHEMYPASDIATAGGILLRTSPDIALVSYTLDDAYETEKDAVGAGHDFCQALSIDNRYAGIPLVGLGDFPEEHRSVLTRHLDLPFSVLDVHKTIEEFLD